MFQFNLTDGGRKKLCTAIGIMAALAAVAAVFIVAAQPALASDVYTIISNKLVDIWKNLGIVISALAAVAVAVCAFKWIMGSNDQEVARAKHWLLGIVIGLALYWLAFAIINSVGDISSSVDKTLDPEIWGNK